MDQSQANLEQHIMERTLWMKKTPTFRAETIKRILYKLKKEGKERSDPFFLARARTNLQNNIYTPEDFV